MQNPDSTETRGKADPPALLNRDTARRSLRRANTAVALLIGSALVLAFSALWQSYRAANLQGMAVASLHRAEAAEKTARADLWRSLLEEAKATRLGQSKSRREEALETIRRATAIAPTAELRNEAIATLALPEDRVDFVLPLKGAEVAFQFDALLQTCAVGLTNGDIALYRTSDAVAFQRLCLKDGGIPNPQGEVVTLTFAPDGDALAARYAGGALAVWDLESGKPRFMRDADRVRGPLSRGFFSSDGKTLVAPVFSPDGFAVLDSHTGAMIAHFPEYGSYHHGAVRPHSTQFAVFSDGKVSLVDWSNHRKLAEYPFPDGARILKWSSDGVQLAIAGNSVQIHVWDVDRGTKTELSGPKESVFLLQFDPTGQRLAGVSNGNTTYYWDLPDRQPVAVFERRVLLCWGDSGLTGWLLPRQRMEVRRSVRNEVYTRIAGVPTQADGYTMDLSPDGRSAISKSNPDGLLVWNLEEPTPPESIPLTQVQSFCFDPSEPKLYLTRNRHLEILDVLHESNPIHPKVVLGPSSVISHVANREIDLMTTSIDGRTRAYVNLPAGAIWVDPPGVPAGLVEIGGIHHSSVDPRSGSARGSASIALSPDGRWLAVGSGDRGTCLFDARTGNYSKQLSPAQSGVQFSPDGRWLVVTTSIDCRVYRVQNWELMWSKPADQQSPNYSGVAALSPDGEWLAVALSSNRAHLLVAETGNEVGVLEGPFPSPLRMARWTRDGRHLVFATRDNALDIWNPAALRRELTRIQLNWESPVGTLPQGEVHLDPPPSSSGRWMGWTLSFSTAIVGFVSLAFLKHHRRLIGEYAKAEALALHRDEELQMERELSELKGRFVSMVSHEFRTPLGVILTSSDLLDGYMDRLSVERRTELIGDIRSSTRRMAEMMDEVLFLSRVESGKLSCRPSSLHLRSFFEPIIDEILSSTDRRCAIRFEAPDMATQADQVLLRHIVTNLLGNAVKYSPADSNVDFIITLDDDWMLFEIADQGIGIPDSDVRRLFEPFHRGANVGDIPGTGLGLTIVKRCVDLHGGTIEWRSREGGGTSFTVQLPVSFAE